MEQDDPAAARMSRIDAIGASLFLALGLLIVYFSWTMPRLENRGVHPLTVPGLVPGLLGAALALCALIILLRALRATRMPWRTFLAGLAGQEGVRVGVVGALALIYTLVLVGNLPFWVATALFVFVFILSFEVYLADARKPLRKSLPWALLVAAGTALAVTLVFERAFLVRLP